MNEAVTFPGSAKTAIITLSFTVVWTEKAAQFFPVKKELSHVNQHAEAAGRKIQF